MFNLRLHFIVMSLGALDIVLINTPYRLDGLLQAAVVQIIAYFPLRATATLSRDERDGAS